MIPLPSNPDIVMTTWDPKDRGPVKQMIETLSLGLGDSQAKDDNSFYWKHIDNPAGHTIFSYAIDTKKNLVISLIGISPRYFWYNGKRRLCYEAVDASTRSEYRRMGIFSGLFRICLETGGNRGGNYTYGFPNFNSIRGFLKVGFKNIGGISMLLKPRKYFKLGWTLARQRSSLSSYKPIYLENKASEFETKYMPGIADILSDGHHAGNSLYGARDVELIRWRFFRRPGFTYFPVLVSGGFAIVNMGMRAGLREAKIIEVVLSTGNQPRKTFKVLLRKIYDDLKLDILSTYVSNDHRYYRLFAENGFVRVPSRIHFATFSHAGITDILENCKWEISGTDIDTE
ncbi:MAG: hypothetical protein NTZ92_07900 [Candidatus Omnitrophica bacterium]|nr:hypothetical protein [Candidatus Omnitrophota bacterium]